LSDAGGTVHLSGWAIEISNCCLRQQIYRLYTLH